MFFLDYDSLGFKPEVELGMLVSRFAQMFLSFGNFRQ